MSRNRHISELLEALRAVDRSPGTPDDPSPQAPWHPMSTARKKRGIKRKKKVSAS